MRTRIERVVDIDAPADQVWDYVTDWPRQEEWIPQTRVENVDDANGLGGRFRAWSGLGPIGFWDPMTITAWERTADGGGRCEVLHRGAVVKGEGEFVVVARHEGSCRFVWAEVVVVRLGHRAAATGGDHDHAAHHDHDEDGEEPGHAPIVRTLTCDADAHRPSPRRPRRRRR